MTNPNFETMTTKKLQTYILEHRDDQEAKNALANRVEATGVKLEFPEQLPDIIESQRQKKQQ